MTNTGVDAEKLNHISISDGNVKWYRYFKKTSQFLKKYKHSTTARQQLFFWAFVFEKQRITLTTNVFSELAGWLGTDYN